MERNRSRYPEGTSAAEPSAYDGASSKIRRVQVEVDMQNLNSDFTNFMELRVCGLQRSGNHAIINWILDQHKGKPACFLNNVRHGDHDPYKTAKQIHLSNLKNDGDLNTTRNKTKHMLIYSYEDDRKQMQENKSLLDSVFDEKFNDNKHKYMGFSKYHFDIVIMRDPFNLFASRIKRLNELTGTRNLDSILKDWVLIARKYLSNKRKNNGMIFINYDNWFRYKDYRKELSRLFLGNFSDASLAIVSAAGGGSSFDSREYGRLTLSTIIKNWKKLFVANNYLQFNHYLKRLFAPGGQSMNVLGRWEELKKDEQFREIFSDEELIALSEKIFGQIPGTREFVAECLSVHKKGVYSPGRQGAQINQRVAEKDMMDRSL